jgi:hypothetical protein
MVVVRLRDNFTATRAYCSNDPLPGLTQGCRTAIMSSPASSPGNPEPSPTRPPARETGATPESPSPRKRARLDSASPLPSTTRAVARALNDELGEHVMKATKEHLTHGWSSVIQPARNTGDLGTAGETKQTKRHPDIQLLEHVGKHGVPVRMETEPWLQDLKDERFNRGLHKSCEGHLDFLREEMLEFVEKGCWTLLPHRLAREMKHLRVLPLGIIPQRERRPRLIVDCSFWEVNGETLSLSPRESMQFGKALERILCSVGHANPRFQDVHMCKVDLKDGFCRIWLEETGVPNLAVAFPTYEGEEPMVAFPLVPPTGWEDSPPWFCAAAKTMADLANTLPVDHDPPPHPM